MISMSVERITLAQARDRLAQRIQAGRELLERSTPDAVNEHPQEMWGQFRIWSDFNYHWLFDQFGNDVSMEYMEHQLTWQDGGRTTIPVLLPIVLPLEIATLESISERLPLWLHGPEANPADSPGVRAARDAPIFIVHGSDTLRAESVAHTVTRATGRKTTILRDEPNSGRTIIEKFEQHAAEVSYAIIVLTADDKGSRVRDTRTRPRGRQNVIFEMGYFFGLIGRKNVSVLIRPGVEKPSDMDGIAYITYDDNGAWKTSLLRDLEHAGFDIRL